MNVEDAKLVEETRPVVRPRDGLWFSLMELNPMASFLFGVFGVALGLGFLMWSNPNYYDYAAGPKLSIFVVMMTLLMTTYFVSVPLTTRSFRNVSRIAWHYDVHPKLFTSLYNGQFWLLLLIFSGLDMAPFLLLTKVLDADPKKFPQGETMTLFVTGIGAIAAFFVTCSVWQVDSATRLAFPGKHAVRARLHDGGTPGVDERSKRMIDDYLALRSELLQSLTVLGLMVSLFTVSVGAFRFCNREYDTALYEKFHPEYVLVLGVYYSGLLGLVLVPPYLRLIDTGRILRDAINPALGGATQSITEFLELRKKLEEALTLNVGLTETFRNSFLVLSPLISGVVPLLIGLGTDTPKKIETTFAPKPQATVSSPVSPPIVSTPRAQEALAPFPKTIVPTP